MTTSTPIPPSPYSTWFNTPALAIGNPTFPAPGPPTLLPSGSPTSPPNLSSKLFPSPSLSDSLSTLSSNAIPSR
ncbi:hypothetical protein NMY22_g8918 [Coprinellus aureogranulatus]|nr:hypothetical protein NMY22_g8918 [Coprinellus aureogranulatus]